MKIVFAYKGRYWVRDTRILEILSAMAKAAGHTTALAYDPDLFGVSDNVLSLPWLNRLLFNPETAAKKAAASGADWVVLLESLTNRPWLESFIKTLRSSAFKGKTAVISCRGEASYRGLASIELLGEPEKAFEVFLKGLGGAGLETLKAEGLADLDALPLPDLDLFSPYENFGLSYMTYAGKGCSGACSYCEEPFYRRAFGRGYVRLRRPARVIEELAAARKRFRTREITFKDSVFTANKAWLSEFLPFYNDTIGIPFKCFGRPDAFDAETAAMLKEAGCYCVEFGLQTYNEKLRSVVLKRPESLEAVKKAFAACDAAGLPYDADYIFGLPGETTADHIAAAVNFSVLKRLNRIKCHNLVYYKGPGITDYALKEGWVDEKELSQGDFFSGDRAAPAMRGADSAFRRLFKLYGLLGGGVLSFAARSGLWRAFRLVPGFLLKPLELLSGLLRGDRRFLVYLRAYPAKIFSQGVLRRYLPAFLVAALLFAAVSPLLVTIRKINANDDFMQLAARHFLLKKALAEHGEFPLRTQFLNGGFPTLGDPEDPSLSPFSALTLLFGEVAGLKLIALLIFAAGCSFMYLMLRRVSDLGRESAAFGALIYGLSGWFITRLYGGNINELYYFLTPGLVLLLERFLVSGERLYLVFASLLLAALAMDGKAVTLSMALFLAFYCAVRGFIFKGGKLAYTPRPLSGFLAFAGLAALFSAIKIIPVLELFSVSGSPLRPMLETHSAAYGDVLSFGWFSFARGLLSPGAPDRAVSLYLGYIPVALFLVSAVACFRKNIVWLASAAFFALLWAGPHSPVDIFHALWRLPLFGTISQPHKYFDFFVLFSACAGAARSFDLAGKALENKPRARAWALAALAAAAALPLFSFSAPKYRSVFGMDAPRVLKAPDFFQVRVDEGRDGFNTYFNSLQGVGTLNWYGAIVLPTRVQPRYFVRAGGGGVPNPAYRGEAYCLLGENKCGEALFKPNRIAAVAEILSRDMLVLNQNYDRRWKSAGGKVVDHGGLLAVEVEPAPGRRLVTLDYRPYGFYWGAAVTLISVLGALLWCFWLPARRRLSA